MKKAMTLLELVMSIALVTLLMAGIGSVAVFARYQATTSSRLTQLQNEGTLILEHMAKNVSGAIGCWDAGGSSVPDNIKAYRNIGPNPNRDIFLIDGGDGKVSGDDHYICYKHAAFTWSFCPDSNFDCSACNSGAFLTLSNHVTQLVAAIRDDEPATLDILLALRWDTASATSPSNPSVSVQTALFAPSVGNCE